MKPTKKQPDQVDLTKETHTFQEAERRTKVDDLSDEVSLDSHVADALKLLADVSAIQAASPQPSSNLPKTIGRYTILGSAGRGGFSEVFHAIDTDLQRHVALKIPLVAGSQDCQNRFEREAQLAAMLSHRQIVPVYEYGNVGQVDYIAYGWIEGETLADWLLSQDDNVDPKLAARIVSELAKAMHFAHERGVVHRDLKPANVLIDQSEDYRDQPIELRTRITDLGLSRNLADDTQRLTQTGQALGTPAYMSPEQASGKTDVGIGTDIYSLGILLFELLTRELPFRRSTAIETIKSISEQPAPDVSKYRPGVSRELAAIVDKCLQKKPSLRYLSAFHLAEDLDAFVQGRPVSAKPVGLTTRAKRWVGRNRVVTAASTLVILSMAIGLAVALWQWNHANSEKERAEKHLLNMTAAVDLLLEDLIAQNEPTKVTIAQRELLKEVLKLQDGLIGDRDYQKFSKSHLIALHRASQIYRAIGQTEDSVTTFEKLRNLAINNSAIDDKDLAKLVFKFYIDGIASLNGIDQGDKAIEATEELSQFQDSVAGLMSQEENAANRITIENLRGITLAANNQFEDALKSHLLAQKYANDLIETDAASNYRDPIATNFINLANCQAELGDQTGALNNTDQAIVFLIEELKVNQDARVTQNLAIAYQIRSSVYLRLKEKSLGKEAAKLSIQFLEKLTRQAPENLNYVSSLAASYSHLASCTDGDSNASMREAIQLCDKLLSLKEKGLDQTANGRMRMVWGMCRKSNLLSRLNELDESLKVTKQAIQFTGEHFSDDDGSLGTAERGKAWSEHMNVLNRLNDSEGFVAAFPEFFQLVNQSIQRYQGSRRVVFTEKVKAWALRRAAKHYAHVGDFPNALLAIENMTKAEMHLTYPRVEFARVTSVVIGIWKESQEYPTHESEAAMDRAFQWLTEAIVEKKWSEPEFFQREDMQAIVDDERFEELKLMMTGAN